MELLLKRAYEPAEATDGYPALVDPPRPRGPGARAAPGTQP